MIITKNERLLSGLIFILWSFGVVLMPNVKEAGLFSPTLPEPLAHYLLWAYFFLHTAVFLFALSALYQHLRLHGKRGGRKAFYTTALYGYVLAALAASGCLLAYSLMPIG